MGINVGKLKHKFQTDLILQRFILWFRAIKILVDNILKHEANLEQSIDGNRDGDGDKIKKINRILFK